MVNIYKIQLHKKPEGLTISTINTLYDRAKKICEIVQAIQSMKTLSITLYVDKQ